MRSSSGCDYRAAPVPALTRAAMFNGQVAGILGPIAFLYPEALHPHPTERCFAEERSL
jgi:hypothetical protein